MRISIVIPAFNEERLLVQTLARVKEAMAAFSSRGWECELIVCDNNSTDRTAELARAAGAKVVFEPVNQIARARNRGAGAASGDWLVFVDADSHPSRELFAEVAQEIAAGRCLAGGCTVKLDGNYPVGNGVVRLWNWLSRTFRLLAGSFIFCDANVFREAGGFGQELFAGEEIELSTKLKLLAKQKGRVIVILHRHPLLTSGRKMELYRPSEHLWFLAKAILWRKKVLTSREQCPTWYDGRR
ncbi:MAG TPA: glycosyltransferase [Candidatus Binatia bacterium]|jgi:glycosyltransferase involved in cell wall biosynthesis|nr:glycosyltransferase [Candidatus Binatia bacterium]